MAEHTEQNRHRGNRDKALAALMVTRTVREASDLSGLGERTIYRYLADPTFQSEYRAARRSAVEHTIAAIQAAASDAVETLVRNLHCEQPAVEVRAAAILIDAAIRGVEIMDFGERLMRLEEIRNGNTQRMA